MSWLRDDPFLIVGMHRSGTTLLARMLHGLGVHLGLDLERNHESVAFLEANDSALDAAHSTWDRPESWPWLLEEPAARRGAVELLRRRIESPRFRWRYAGVKSFVGRSRPSRWGFKDPRATLTLPLWLELFPRARVVILRRHGIDVAASLRHRARQQIRIDSSHVHDPHLLRFASLRCLELERAFALWKFYNDFFDGPLRPEVPCLDLHYEQVLANPLASLSEVVDFLELPSDRTRMQSQCPQVRSDRAFAYRSDAELAAFAERVVEDETLRRLGYTKA